MDFVGLDEARLREKALDMIDLIAIGVAAIIVILRFIGSELSDLSHQLPEINDALVDIRDADSEQGPSC